jgi:TatD DNase family protein
MFYDAHAHLDSVKEVKNALKEAKKARVKEIVSCSSSIENSKTNLELKKFEQIKAGIGLYPLNAIELSESKLKKAFNFFEENLKKADVIGEVGLDYKYSKEKEERGKQKMVFRKFIKMSNEFEKPIVVHTRHAQKDVIKLLEEERAENVLLHSFVDDGKLMRRAKKNGWLMSVGFVVMWHKEIQERIKKFDENFLLAETDAPLNYENELIMPKDIPRIVGKIAELKDMSLKELEEIFESNYKKLF